MIRRPPRSTLSSSSAASDVYKRQHLLHIFRTLNFFIFYLALRINFSANVDPSVFQKQLTLKMKISKRLGKANCVSFLGKHYLILTPAFVVDDVRITALLI